MRKLNVFLLSLFMVAFIGCNDDEDDNGEPSNGGNGNGNGNNNTRISENITSDQTWESDNVYILADRISVTNDATLTIQPGTIIKGEVGEGENATALVIAKDGKLMAEGTADEPIIFTSVADEIQPGSIESPNLSSTKNGLWGGVLVLGDAPISADQQTIQIEGIPASDPTGQYGGSNPSHNSGVIKYISIRHGGANIGEGNEINGLTLGGVGTETVVENVEVVANQDDGLECFGGTVNPKNVIVWNQADDAFDMDQAYKGTVDNFIGIAGPDSDHALELDGPEGSAKGTYTLQNGTLKGWHNENNENGGEYADLRDGATTNLKNLYFFNFSKSSDFEFDEDAIAENYKNDEVTFSNLEFNVDHLSEGNTTIEAIFQDEGDDNEDVFETKAPDASIVSSPSVEADKSVFDWTWVSAAGELNDL